MAQEDDLDLDLAAAGLRADGTDALRDVEVLAAKLEQALPGHCRVERRRTRLLSGDKRVEALEVEVAGTTYGLRSDGRTVRATRGRSVGGVTIKRDELDLATWIRDLTGDLREQARTSGEAREALDRLLRG